MRAPRSLALVLVSSLTVFACAAPGDGDDAESGESDLTEGSPEARAVLALVNDPAVTADELRREAKAPAATASAIVGHRDGGDARPGTADDDPFDTLRELDDIRGVGPATLKKLFDYARAKGLFESGAAVVFSPQAYDASHLARVVREIDTARTSIDIAMYSYSDAKITAALTSAKQRGVKVRFVYEEGGPNQRAAEPMRASTTSMKLESAGADVRFINKVMHHKFMIVDGPRDDRARAKTARLVTGSANWSNSAATRFDENTLFLSNVEELALRFQREFELMWGHSRDFEGKPFDKELGTADLGLDGLPAGRGAGVLFTSANFTVENTTFSSTAKNTVADALVAGIHSATRSIHIASGHLRSRPVSEALIAKKQAAPNVEIRVYLDGQEFIAKGTHDDQLEKLDTCLDGAGDSESKRRNCTDKGFLFGYQVGEAGIDVRYKYYAYRWDHSYAPQMHHKFMIVDGERLYTGSYNLSDNAEHGTFENMLVFEGAEHRALVRSFEDNFESIWNTGRDGKLEDLTQKVESAPSIPLVFDPMALTWSEVSSLKSKIRTHCTAVDSDAFRSNAAANTTCAR